MYPEILSVKSTTDPIGSSVKDRKEITDKIIYSVSPFSSRSAPLLLAAPARL
jgi:hypothetical protein